MPGQREMDWHIVATLADVHKLARSNKWHKLLCFCNKRQSVEMVARELATRWQPYPVVTHHGSLTRRVREDAEALMKEADVAVCVSTSTLEIGIDIGDIDLVVLAEIPWSVSALLQRVGRGSRRSGRVQIAALAQSSTEKNILEAMLTTARDGQLPIAPYHPDLSVVVQQTFSYLFQHTVGVSLAELAEIFQPLADTEIVQQILDHLQDDCWIEQRAGRYFASTKIMDMGEKGSIHSNIPDSQTRTVVDVDTGTEIGTVAGLVDDVFVLARHAWKIVKVTRTKIGVRRYTGTAGAPIFSPHSDVGAFTSFLPPRLRIKKPL